MKVCGYWLGFICFLEVSLFFSFSRVIIVLEGQPTGWPAKPDYNRVVIGPTRLQPEPDYNKLKPGFSCRVSTGLAGRVKNCQPYWRLTVRTAIPLGPDTRSLIWKLLAADVRPSGRQCLTVRTWLSNRKDFQKKSRKFWSHNCPSGRPMSTVRTALVYISAVAYLNPQPINRGSWALRTARIRYWIPL
jgi:hypothetical protein